MTETRTYTWEDPLDLAATTADMTGLQFISAIAAGELPPAPIAATLGMSIVEVEHGHAVFAIEPASWMFNPIGSVHGGIAATLLDSCMGCCVHTTLDAGVGYTTTDIQIRYLRAMPLDRGRVLAEGTVAHSGRRTATANGRLFLEQDGTLIATGTTGCLILG